MSTALKQAATLSGQPQVATEEVKFRPFFDSARSSLYVSPAAVLTMIKTIREIIGLINDGKTERADRAFQERVVSELAEIKRQLAAVRTDIAELGVRLEAKIDGVAPSVAENALSGALDALATAWTSLPTDQTSARRLFDNLNNALGAFTASGPANCNTAAVALLALERAHRMTARPSSVLTDLFKTHAGYFRQSVDGTAAGSLQAQMVQLQNLLAEARTNIAEFASGPRKLGTHNYGRTRVIENVSRENGWFRFWLTEEEIPQERRRPPGPIDRSILLAMAVAVDPLPAQDLILYTTYNAAARRPVPSRANFAPAPPADQHFNEWANYAAQETTAANICVSLERQIEERTERLDESLALAKAILALIDTRTGVLEGTHGDKRSGSAG